MDHFTIYKVTNMVNGRFYIGKHQTKDLDDEYMGSGKLIQRAIKKYGIENFKKEILFVFATEAEMNAKEAELVTEELIDSGSVYNLCPGGQGGWGYVNREVISPQMRREIGHKGGQRHKDNVSKDDKLKQILTERILSYRQSGNNGSSKGLKLSKQARSNIGRAMKGKQDGLKNSQFGTMWITNGTENRKIKKDLDSIPEGWYKGRK